MMFSDWLKENNTYRAGTSTSPAPTKVSQHSITSGTSVSKPTFSQWLQQGGMERKAKPATASMKLQTDTTEAAKPTFSQWLKTGGTAKNWAKESVKLLDEIQSYYRSWHETDNITSRNFQSRASNLISASDEWLKQYDGNQEATSYISSVVSALDNVGTYTAEMQDAFAACAPTQEQMAEGITGQDLYEQLLQESAWLQDYAGLNYDQLKKKLHIMPQDTDEYSWLTSYAPTVMTAKDYDSEIVAVDAELKTMEAVLDEYNLCSNTMSTQDLYNDYSYKRQQEIIKQYGHSGEIKNKIEELKTQKWNLENGKKYNLLSMNEDFSQRSGYTSTELDNWWQKQTSQYDMGYADLTYEYINNQVEGIRFDIRSSAYQSRTVHTNFELYDYMTDKEILVYNYLYSKEGKKAADEYLDYLEDSLNAREMKKLQKNVVAFAKEHPFLANAISVGGNLMGGIGALDILGQKIEKDIKEAFTGEYAGPINYNSAAQTPTIVSSTIRGTRAQLLSKSSSATLEKLGIQNENGIIAINEEDHPILSRVLNGRSVGDVYTLGMSAVDSFVASRLSPFLGKNGSTLLLAGNAATQTILDKASQGATDGQALTMGILAGTFEFLFERYELENLLGKDTNFIRKSANQALTEALGEGGTSLANTVADIIIMAKDSGLNKAVAVYMQEHPGCTKSEATLQTLLDIGIDIGWDMVGGGFTGSIMGGSESILQNISYALDNNALTAIEQTKNTTAKSGVLYQLKQYSQHQKDNWKNSKRIVLYEGVDQFRSFIKNALTAKTQTNKKMYFGSIGSELATAIAAETNIDVEGYNLSLGENEIRKINKDHGNEQTETLRGQRAVTEADYLNIPNVVQSPDSISLSPKQYSGKPVIEFRKTNGNETTVIAAVVSDKRLDLFVQTTYVNKKSGSIATPESEQADSNTPKATGGTAPIEASQSTNAYSPGTTPGAKSMTASGNIIFGSSNNVNPSPTQPYSLSDPEVRRQLLAFTDRASLTDGQQLALDVFKRRMGEIASLQAQLQEQQSILARKQANGVRPVDQNDTKNRIALLKTMLTREQNELLSMQSAPGLLQVLEKNELARSTEKVVDNDYTVAEYIGRSVGAKAKNYKVYNPITGESMPLTEGTYITQPKNHVMAGKDRDRQIDQLDFLLDTYGGDPLEWTKEKGFGYVDDEYGESHYVELHWYQEPSAGKVRMKIKVQPDGRIYLDED